jgi:glycosyltransferase involved in cell wall biosynthesis
MSVYNHEKYVSEAIESVLSQTFRDFELIILDNGSRDRSSEIIKGYKDDRIIFLTETENKSAYWGVERCFNTSKGKYIAFIGSDDVWHGSKLEKQLGYIEKNPNIGMIFTEAATINSEGKRLDGSPFVSSELNMSRHAWLRHFFFFSNCVCWPSCMMERSLKPPSSHSDARFKQLGDLYLWTTSLQKKNIYIFPEVLTYYRQHGGNESNKEGDKVYNRGCVESYYILNLYKTIPATELKVVFPELNCINNLNESNKLYYLAKMAIEKYPDSINANSRKLFGVLALFDLYSDPDVVRELELTEQFGLDQFYSVMSTSITFLRETRSSFLEQADKVSSKFLIMALFDKIKKKLGYNSRKKSMDT